MFGLEKLFKPKPDYKLLVQQGAIIVDVRSAGEFAGGHVKGAKNISLELVNSRLKELQQLKKPVITCCRSGVRSAMAARILKATGITVYNGGPWDLLQQQLAAHTSNNG